MIKQVASKRILEINLRQLNYEQQRFRRFLRQPKPLWKPVSVQKLFNVQPAKKLSEEDQELIEQDELRYRDQYNSIKEYFNQEFTIPFLQGGSNIELKEVKEEHLRLIKENEEENERVARLREQRLKIEVKKEELEDFKKKLIENEDYQVKKEQAIKCILKEKERYSTYITKDKLKDAIETALDHPISYEFAIDLNGTLVFSDRLHPYALKPSEVPESDDIINDHTDSRTHIQLEGKIMYYD